MSQSTASIFCGKFGLLLNIVGSLLIAMSFGKNLGEAYQEDEKANKIYLASFTSPKMFKWGIGLLIAGFFLQILS